MAQPIALHAHVSLSEPARRLIPLDRNGRVADRPDWVSLDVHVEVGLDDGRLVVPETPFLRGGTLDCSRRELEEEVRGLIFSEPRYLQGDSRTEPAHLVVDDLAALPLTVAVADEVEAIRSARDRAPEPKEVED